MYEVFDSYLNVDTWHTSHPLDGRRFFKALSRVVDDPDFNADQMGQYMRQKKNVSDETHPFFRIIQERVSDAWAVKEYLEAINL